jgi:hypothetical protein
LRDVTPNRVGAAPLVVVVILLLCEHLRTFPFCQPKGNTVLVALALVAITMVLLLVWFLVAVFFGLRFQFGLRSLLVLVVVVAIPCSWLATEVNLEVLTRLLEVEAVCTGVTEVGARNLLRAIPECYISYNGCKSGWLH